jgi:diguanylate cyclase (GGDEF)-like protein
MRILIAEDDPVSRRVLQATLVKWGHEVTSCSDGPEAWRELQKDDSPSLLILDWMMPGMDGIEICRKVRQLGREPYSFILLLTAKSQKEDIVVGMEAGADDYITKPFDKNELKVRLRAGERILKLQDELISAREALREQATHDPLTGLWNHASILDILKQELVRARRQEISVGVVMIDLDHFKNINDTYGHLAGDKVLHEAAQRIKAATRPYDHVGRYGGEEFLLVLPGCDDSNALSLAERLCACVNKEGIRIDEGLVKVTISLGTVSCSNAKEVKVNSLIQAADKSLYQAKNAGRNRAVLGSLEEDVKTTSVRQP